MFTYLILLFTIIPALELVLLIKVGTYIGAFNTLAVVILTGVTGAYLARLQGFLVLQKIQQSLNDGIMPNAELLDGAMILVGGVLLLTPGFMTDAVGFALLIPSTRALVKLWLQKKLAQMLREGRPIHVTRFSRRRSPFDDDFEDIDLN